MSSSQTTDVAAEVSNGEIVLGPVYSLRTGVQGGVVGGVVMAFVAALAGIVTGMGIWYPLNLVGAALLRGLSPAALEQFNAAALAAGALVHFGLSITLGVAFVLLLPTLPGRTFVWSIIIGLALWALAQFAVVPIVNPLMASELNVPSFVLANLAYSITLGLYVEYSEPIEECCYQVLDTLT